RAWESRQRRWADRIVVIDDLARVHDCDLVIDPSDVESRDNRRATWRSSGGSHPAWRKMAATNSVKRSAGSRIIGAGGSCGSQGGDGNRLKEE
ncbi:MAG: hypothetical protein ACKOGA_17115, partial [Planctomycetaceae bacterium]